MVKFGGWGTTLSNQVVWKLTFVFVYFEVGISSTYIPISTNNILKEILVWVLKWNRFGFFIALKQLKIPFIYWQKTHLKYYSDIFYKFSLLQSTFYVYRIFIFHKSILTLYQDKEKRKSKNALQHKQLK